ncbi:MAG: hypothetical protein JST16_01115 [Bdellovibrionales bacterium]|nr:hypothetical protein [Bdellovibrionales bacterium]
MIEPPNIDVEQYQRLLPIAEKLYNQTDHIAQMLLLPLFLLSILFAYSQDLGLSGAIVSRIKRLVMTALLLAAFPTLSSLIRDVGQEIALSIDSMSGLDSMLKAAAEKASRFSLSINVLRDIQANIITGFCVTASFVLVYFARFGIVAFYHFYWLVLLVTAPLLILGHLFEATANLPKNLFKNLVLVGCWPIIWAILSAFLRSLPFSDMYANDQNLMTIMVMNLILVAGLVMSPFLLSQFCEGAITGSGSVIYGAGKALLNTVTPKVGTGISAMARAGRFGRDEFRKSNVYHRISGGKGGLTAIVFMLCFSAFEPSRAAEPSLILKPGNSTLLCLKQPPLQAALGDPRYFQVSQMGQNLVLRAIKDDKATNLIVYFGKNLFESYSLKSNQIMPPTTSYGCEAPKLDVSKSNAISRVPLIESVSSDHVNLQLIRAIVNGPTRDHLTLKLRIANLSDSVVEPDWKKVVLTQGNRRSSHSKLWSERRRIESGASIMAELQFSRTGFSYQKPTILEIPREDGDSLKLVISPERIK